MRTHIVIDDELVKTAMRLTGKKIVQEVVEFALKELIRSYKSVNASKKGKD